MSGRRPEADGDGYRRLIRALSDAGELVAEPDAPVTLTGVADDSRAVGPGMLFCAVRGTANDGRDFVPHAAARGAAAVLLAEPVAAALPQIVVRDDRRATAVAAAAWWGRPGDRLALIGVTGTNGKSTTVAVARHLLNGSGDVGAIGTLGAFDGAGEPLPSGGLTTPGAVGLHATLAEMVSRGVRTVAMEVSSHALDQRRVEGLRFQAATFTNLTHEHLDYHRSLDAYRRAKLRLATCLRDDGAQVVNLDDPAWQDLPDPGSGGRVTFAVSHPGADVRADDVRPGPDGTAMRLVFDASRRAHGTPDGGFHAFDVALPLLGAFNVSNALAAAATAAAVGLAPDRIARRLSTAPQVAGRMERLPVAGRTVLRDYAHTPDALERAIDAARALTAGRLVVLFGCGGDRDREKRAPMGRIAIGGADVVVVTSDNPRTEDPEAIIDDIVAGMEGRAFVRVADRREAMARALAMLGPDDCLLLAGKGHETYQVIGTERRPFDEREIVASLAGEAA